jgi:TolA-binding protein
MRMTSLVALGVGGVGVAAAVAVVVSIGSMASPAMSLPWEASPVSAQGGGQAGSASVEAREHLRRGTELARQGLFDGAVAEFRKYVTAVPNDADGHFLLGRSLL